MLWLEEQHDWYRFGSADHQGAMLALVPPAGIVSRIRIEDGEPEDQIHLTLLYFEDKAAEREDWDEMLTALREIATKHGPLKGKLGGYGLFAQAEPVLWASVDVPGLAEFKHELTNAVETAGFDENKTHGFTPHITLKYGWQGELPELKEPLNLEFGEVFFFRGEQRESVKLGTQKTAMAERTGDSELDRLIEEWTDRDHWDDSWYYYDNEDEAYDMQDLRNPNLSEGLCYDVAQSFMMFLVDHGVTAYDTTDPRWKGNQSPEAFGYHDLKHRVLGEHHWTIIEKDGHTYGVDWTASQYGYKEFPMVQRLDGGEWQREWQSKTAGIMDHRIPFFMFPTGLVEMGRPGWDHSDVGGEGSLVARGEPVDQNYWHRLYETHEGTDFQGHIIFDPESGEQIEQWPIDQHTLQEHPWIRPEWKDVVRREARQRYEQFGAGAAGSWHE